MRRLLHNSLLYRPCKLPSSSPPSAIHPSKRSVTLLSSCARVTQTTHAYSTYTQPRVPSLAQACVCLRSVARRCYATSPRATMELAFSRVSPPHTDEQDASTLPATLILHGLFGSGNNWRNMSRKLSEATSSNVYLMDLRNHGSSPHSEEMDYDIMAEDVKEFIDRHSLGPVTVIGHSMGGKTAMVLALRYPQIVKRLVIVDIAPHSLSNAINTFSTYSEAMGTLDFDKIKTRNEADAALKPAVPDTNVRLFLLTNLLVTSDKLQWKCNLPVLHNSMQKIMDFPETGTTYKGPTLFIGGGNSKYISSKHMPAINRLFPNSKVTYLEGAGHWVHAEKPQEFFNVASEFLKKE